MIVDLNTLLKRCVWRGSLLFVLMLSSILAQAQTLQGRERISMDDNWRFALGHATDKEKDFNYGTGYFSYIAKTGYGDGPARAGFDDRVWRSVNLPHDWAVEMPYDAKASHSHGYKAVGPGFPENSVGWYRHHFTIPQSDLGRRIRVEFDGIQRDARIFVNGFLIGQEMNGNVSQRYDVTAYLNYGEDNVIAVRADVSLEAGWYYEGAGINRHVYLLKTAPVHVDADGTAVTTAIENNTATITVKTTLMNEQENTFTQQLPAQKIKRIQTVVDANGKQVAKLEANPISLNTGTNTTETDEITLANPVLWSLENPYLYSLITQLQDENGKLLDAYTTPFGVRSIRFDPNQGFFLNGKHVKLKGANNHEDHAGVGTALPDSLIEFRLQQLKAMGVNTYRTSHAPAAPALLDLADRMGILVIDENRLMGINDLHLKAVEQMIKRDRNHPSVILWSLGNEEWGIEGNVKGARIANTMQNFARSLDPSRLNTAAISGGWGGISSVIGVAGVNYIKQGDTDKQHKNYPQQIILGTEETTTQQTRGIYSEDKTKAHLPPQDDGSSGGNAEQGWKHYAERPYTAGVVYWTGFDYRGEPTPYGFPAVLSQFGILDTCGFPKDDYYYLKSWWTNEPVLHIFPHWNWPGREGQPIQVNVNSNSEEVELFLNKKSLGKKAMPVNGHLEWTVNYEPGELFAKGFTRGIITQEARVATTGKAAAIKLSPHKTRIAADGRAVSVITVSVVDDKGRVVPVADNNIQFAIEGAGKIIGVGNGNPSSHEADVQVASVVSYPLSSQWQPPKASDVNAPVVYDVTFDRPQFASSQRALLILSALGKTQTVTLNGKQLYQDATPEKSALEIPIDKETLKTSGNQLHIVAQAYADWGMRESLAQVRPASVRVETPAAPYTRNVFNGYAQIIVQANPQPGTIKLTAKGEGLQSAKVVIAVNANP